MKSLIFFLLVMSHLSLAQDTVATNAPKNELKSTKEIHSMKDASEVKLNKLQTLENLKLLTKNNNDIVRFGGGGDASEIRVDEIRSDILRWILEGGAKGLRFDSGVTLEDYN